MKAPPRGGFRGGRTQIDSAIVFCRTKNKSIDISMFFYFAISAKNGIFVSLMLRSAHNSDKWRFNASFILFVT